MAAAPTVPSFDDGGGAEAMTTAAAMAMTTAAEAMMAMSRLGCGALSWLQLVWPALLLLCCELLLER